VVGERRYGIYFIQHPEAGGVFVPNGVGDRWLYGREWDPGPERLEDYTDERLAGLIRSAAAVPELPDRSETDGSLFNPLFKIKDDPRVTRVGRVLRRFSLDELPQLPMSSAATCRWWDRVRSCPGRRPCSSRATRRGLRLGQVSRDGGR
jgi:Bacterial sugar transferase